MRIINPTIAAFEYTDRLDSSKMPGYRLEDKYVHESMRDLLEDWRDQESCSSMPSFLERTGLERLITPEKFDLLYSGKMLPDTRIARLIALHLPGYILRPDERRLAYYPTPRGFEHKVATWRAKDFVLASNILFITDEEFHSFREKILAEFHLSQPLLIDIPSAEETEALNNVASHITSQLLNIARKIDVVASEETVRAGLVASYQKNPHALISSLEASLPEAISEEEIGRALESLAPKAKLPPAARALTFLRQSVGVSLPTLAARLDISTTTVWRWENGRLFVNVVMLDTLHKMLQCSDAEVTLAKLSDLVRPPEPATAKQNVPKTKQPVLHPLPALDPIWLQAQPVEMQGGLLLRDFLHRLNNKRLPDDKTEWPQSRIARELTITKGAITHWKKGIRAIPEDKWTLWTQLLELSAEEIIHFQKIVKRSNLAIRENTCFFSRLFETWRKAEGCNKTTDFHEKTGLGHLLSLDEYRSIGHRAIPDKRLLRLMSLHLPGYDLRPDELPIPGLSPQIFINKTEKWYAQKQNTCHTVISLSEDRFHAFRLHVLQGLRIAATAANSIRGGGCHGSARALKFLRHSLGKSQAQLAEAVGVSDTTIRAWEAGVSAIDNLKAVRLADSFECRAEEKDEFLQCLLPALDEEWLGRQPEHMRTGLLLRTLREKAGMYQSSLGEKVGVDQTTILAWEAGNDPINPDKMIPLALAFGLSVEEKSRLENAAEQSNPVIRAIKREKYRMKKSQISLAEGVSLPAGEHPELLLSTPAQDRGKV